MNQYLWINRWNDIRKKSAITKQKEGLTFLSIYTMEDFKRVLSELYMGLQMNEGSMTSRYVCFIPPNGNEVIKLRLSDHPSSPSEWGEKEITGLPNRRYSIVLFSKKSMPIETKQGIKELDWKSYSAQNIPTYEKTFNRYYLRETFDTLKSILATIYQGGSPEDNTIPINLAENETRNNMNKKLIRLTESDLHRIVKESVNRVLREGEYNFASGTGNYDVNSDEWKTNYDRMSNDYRGQEKKSNLNLMDLQIAHHNGMKGRGGYNGELSKTKQMSPKGKAESIDTIISSGLRRVNGGIAPREAFSDFRPFSEEEKQYYSDDMISQYYIPIGTVYGDTFMLIYDTKKEKYIVPKEPIEL